METRTQPTTYQPQPQPQPATSSATPTAPNATDRAQTPAPLVRRLGRSRWQQQMPDAQQGVGATLAPRQLQRDFPVPSWLNTLVANSLGDFEATPDLDRRLSALAVQARDDHAVRDDLLCMLAYKVARFHLRVVRRARAFAPSGTSPIDSEDLAQECFFVFVEVLHGWKPLPDAGATPRGFVYYFLRVFPLRLQDRVAAAQRAERLTTTGVPLDLLADEPGTPRASLELDVQTTVMLQEIAARIDPADLRLVLEHRTRAHGSPLPASKYGLSRRTYYRRLAHITSRLRHLA